MTIQRDLKTNVEPVRSLPVQAHTGAANGAAVTRAQAEAFTFVLDVGAWTDGTHVITFEEDLVGDGTWTPIQVRAIDGWDNDTQTQLLDAYTVVTDPAVLTIGDATLDNLIITLEYIPQGGVQQMRAVTTPAGTTTGAVYGVAIWRFRLRDVGKNPMRLAEWNAANTTP